MLERLDKRNVEDIIALTPTQEGILFHHIEDKFNDTYVLQLCIDLGGKIDLDIFKEAWNYVIKINPALRTIFRWEGLTVPVQIILKENQPSYVIYDFRNENIDNANLKSKEIIFKDRKKTVDIKKNPFRITLIVLPNDLAKIIISTHHILYDGWSNSIIVNEFLNIYSNLYKGNKLNITMKPDVVSSYVKWLKNKDIEESKEYWNKHLQGMEEHLGLQTSQALVQSSDERMIQKYSLKINSRLYEELQKLARDNHITLASILYSAWAIFLLKYNGVNEAAFGVTVSGRDADVSGIIDAVGVFINTLPLRVCIDSCTTVDSLIKSIDNELKNRKGSEWVSLLDILDWSGYKGTSTLYNTNIVIENYPIDDKSNDIIQVYSYDSYETSHFDLTLQIILGKQMRIDMFYNSYLYSQRLAERIFDYFNLILNKCIEFDSRLKDLCIISKIESNNLIKKLNDTDFMLREEAIHVLFENQVRKTPDRIAVIWHGQTITYDCLNRKANSFARFLLKKGVQKESVVAIMVHRSFKMIICLIGILKAGCAYLPIEIDYPDDKINYMLNQCDVKFILSDLQSAKKIEGAYDYINIDDEQLYEESETNIDLSVDSKNLSYVLFTSGSTGRPKGVMIEHRSVCNFIKSFIKETSMSEGVILALTSVTFDIFVVETFVSLSAGLKIVMVDDEQQKDPEKIGLLALQNNVDIMQATPSRINQLLLNDKSLKWMKSLKKIFIGGEPLSDSIINRLYCAENTEIYNLYGPTETTVWSTIKKIIPNEKITIGKPIGNTQIYILGTNHEVLPLGVIGEIYIGGKGVARGYLNNPVLTAKSFILNPFREGERIYKTGDRARWLENGELEFIGRVDNQVKIRGHRVELEGIESVMKEISLINDAAVVIKQDVNNNPYLCAFISGSLSETEIREYLKNKLADYMIPSKFVFLRDLPVNSSGKVDRTRLKITKINYSYNINDIILPKSEIEKKVALIWEQILEMKITNINSNFFELGGNSINLIKLISYIYREFNIQISVKDIMSMLTVREISYYLLKESKTLKNKIGLIHVKDMEYYPASPAQSRMYVSEYIGSGNICYNIPIAIEVSFRVDLNKIMNIFNVIVNRHEALRTSFAIRDNEIVQIIHKNIEIAIQVINDKIQTEDDIIKSFVKPFNLYTAPLFRIGIHYSDNNKTMLLFDIHHIICDRRSVQIIINEFFELSNDNKLMPLTYQYKDYSVWYNNLLNSDEVKVQEKYWLDLFNDYFSEFKFPTDYTRPLIKNFEGDMVTVTFDLQKTRMIENKAAELHVTLYMFLLATFNVVLHKYSGQEDIIVGTPFNGRVISELDMIVGMFVNILPLRNFPKADVPFISFLDKLKDNTLKAMSNSDYQFNDLIDKLEMPRKLNTDSLCNVVFDLEYEEGISLFDTKQYTVYKMENNLARYDLTLNAFKKKDSLTLNFIYWKSIFKKSTIDNMIKSYNKVLEAVIENPNQKLSDIDIRYVD
ncbi:amino acid adenylation domain-containing protein [Tissierella carlieri]|uniref:Amino acid adenylation domain-containing protein n=1 Tax=Tissierella carlieri TaxID=689904 RepID=A0ABT1S5B0_9FIRM|nr:amino acid adenylation domain-containing protein [Tissierella carlieri]MCQ4921650.1 amino acid adenylation domain-containing protein [Tissierella carlieri]